MKIYSVRVMSPADCYTNATSNPLQINQEFPQKSVGHSSNLRLRATLHWCTNESGFPDVCSVVPEETPA